MVEDLSQRHQEICTNNMQWQVVLPDHQISMKKLIGIYTVRVISNSIFRVISWINFELLLKFKFKISQFQNGINFS